MTKESGNQDVQMQSPLTKGASAKLPVFFYVVIAVGTFLLGAILITYRAIEKMNPLPVYFQVPVFSLIDQDEKLFTNENLKGKAWVTDFVFTRCSGICPLLSARLSQIAKESAQWKDVASRTGFLSISVDPEYDTPERLAEYGKRFEADPARWRFVTGEADQIRNLVTGGFRISLSHAPVLEGQAVDPGQAIIHGDHFLLVDSEGYIRGIYAQDEEAMEKLKIDLRNLAGRTQ